MGKKNISVIAKFTEEGTVTPQMILWEDGRKFEIDRVMDIRRAASLKGGGIGIRFSCLIRGKAVYLFKDENIWYVEVAD